MDLPITSLVTWSIWDLSTVRVLEFQRCKTEHGIERSTSTKSQVTLEDTSGIIDLTLPSNGSSISCTVVPVNSSFKDGLLTSDAEFGFEWSGSQPQSTSSVPWSARESMITTPTITSTSLTEWRWTPTIRFTAKWLSRRRASILPS